MPSSDYSAAIGGGLKLKGAKDAGIKKRHKKKSKVTDTNKGATGSEQQSEKTSDETALQKALADEEQNDELQRPREQDLKDYGKTEAQRRFDERRKKRLDERLKREGVLTHKERVEQLNRYLSGLSEHHDMPRIGPG